jgi:ribosomal protein L35
MPKIKTHSGAKKRFKITKNGKVLHAKTNKRHKLNSAAKPAKRKRSLRKVAITDKTNVAQVKRLLPYK